MRFATSRIIERITFGVEMLGDFNLERFLHLVRTCAALWFAFILCFRLFDN